VGDSLNGFTDVLRRRKSIDWIHMRHEGADRSRFPWPGIRRIRQHPLIASGKSLRNRGKRTC